MANHQHMYGAIQGLIAPQCHGFATGHKRFSGRLVGYQKMERANGASLKSHTLEMAMRIALDENIIVDWDKMECNKENHSRYRKIQFTMYSSSVKRGDLVRIGPDSEGAQLGFVTFYAVLTDFVHIKFAGSHKDTGSPASIEANIVLVQPLFCHEMKSGTIHLKNASDSVTRDLFWLGKPGDSLLAVHLAHILNPAYSIKLPLPRKPIHDPVIPFQEHTRINCIIDGYVGTRVTTKRRHGEQQRQPNTRLIIEDILTNTLDDQVNKQLKKNSALSKYAYDRAERQRPNVLSGQYQLFLILIEFSLARRNLFFFFSFFFGLCWEAIAAEFAAIEESQ